MRFLESVNNTDPKSTQLIQSNYEFASLPHGPDMESAVNHERGAGRRDFAARVKYAIAAIDVSVGGVDNRVLAMEGRC